MPSSEQLQGKEFVPDQAEIIALDEFKRNQLASGNLILNPTHDQLFSAVDPGVPENFERWGVTITDTGAWAEVNPAPERARNPEQTKFVGGGSEAQKIYWADTVGFQPIEREVSTRLCKDSLALLRERTVYQTERQVGAAEGFAFPVDTITDSPSSAAFSNNMFLDRDPAAVAGRPPLTVIVLPHDSDKINPADYGLEGQLGKDVDGDPRRGIILTDPETGIVLIRGFAYHGPIKKTIFTLMNHYLPDEGVFPLHASANEGPDGDVAIFSGLSGTGKSTLSNLIPGRQLINDDEIYLTRDGVIAGMENGVYPIVLGVDPKNEPALHEATFTVRPPHENRTLLQNVVVDEAGHVDVDDDSLTKNTRVSVPMEYIPGSKESKKGGPPKNMVFITMDANGVLPPIALLDAEQALFWDLMGPTSTTSAEVGVKPGATFSRFFGAPFMSRHPSVYMELLAKTIQTYQPKVWLINTGYTGGPQEAGASRINIPDTEAMLASALKGDFDAVGFRYDERFKLKVPLSVPGSESATRLLVPRNTWQDPAEYDRRADEYAAAFQAHFDKKYASDPDLTGFGQFSPAPLGS